MPDFLLEIGCEEIPARMIAEGARELAWNLDLAWQHATAYLLRQRGQHFWTPRRLVVHMRDLPAQEPDIERDELGPSCKVAFKDGAPTAAANAFAKKHGVPTTALIRTTTPKGEYVAVRVVRRGRATGDVIKTIVRDVLEGFSWPKTMYWRGSDSERFVRPIRWIVALLGEEIVPIEFAGIVASRTSRGHRTIGSSTVDIQTPSTYADTLLAAKVIINPQDREQQIRKQLDAAARTIPGARWREDMSLLDTVANLTEWPSVILGSFDPEFLELPEEVLVTVMRDHQKYFAVEDGNHKLLPHFLAVLNTDGDPQGTIQHGHERVLRARFNDARFFWQTDQKHPLRERTEWLKHVTFQKDLGSYYDKTKRVQELCRRLSVRLKNSGVPGMEKVRSGIIHKAAWLAKTDLTTELVKEFTELQGIVGGLYARAQVLDPDMKNDAREAVAVAIYDQYKPESMEDSVPRTLEAAVLSIADKADTIAGMFALGLQPTGSKDPFALRRQANGIVKTIAEHKLPIALSQLFTDAREIYQGSAAEGKFSRTVDYAGALRTFFRERLEFYLKDALGFRYDVVKAVLGADSDDAVDVIARAKAVTGVLHMPEFLAIAAACKRMRNIVRQAEEKGFKPTPTFEYLPESAQEEKNLAAYVKTNAERIEAHQRNKEYGDALLLLSTVREQVDSFFDKVMVMVEDERIRANRLALLRTLLKEFSTIADFSEIVTEGKGAGN